jgi:hypothetical protein
MVSHEDFRLVKIKASAASWLTQFFRSLRQMAAIVLRRNLASLLKAASPPSQASLKQIVLESLYREQHDQVSSAIAVLTSQVKHSHNLPHFFDFLLELRAFHRRPSQFSILNPLDGLSCFHFCSHASLKEPRKLKQWLSVYSVNCALFSHQCFALTFCNLQPS